MKKLLCLVLVLCLVFSLAGCGQTGFTDETINIGSVGPLTGPVAIYGVAVKNAADLAVKEINANGGVLGKQIAFVALDDKGDAVEATNAYNKLSSMGMDVLLGAVTSQPTEAVAQIAFEEGMPMVTATATMASITEGRTNVFRTCYTDPFQGEILAKYVAESLKLKSVAVMYNTSDDYSDGVATAFRNKCEELGVEVVANEGYAGTDKDFNSQLTKIAATNPEALIVPDYYSVAVLIASQARAMGITVPMIGPDGYDGVLSVVDENNKDITNNMFFANHYFVGSEEENVKNFVANYKAAYNEEPNAFAASSYDAIYLLADAIERAGSTDKQAVIDALYASDYNGVAGRIKYDGTGDPIKSVYILEIKDGAYQLIDKIES